MLPMGLHYIDSWLAKEGDRCFQFMETDNYALFADWMEKWTDLGRLEIVEIGPKPVKET